MNSLQKIISEQNIAKENANQLIEAFGAPFEEAGLIISSYKNIVVTEESQTDLMKEAREKRLILKKVRTGVENKRKELKADYLVVTNAIDGIARYIKSEIEPAEDYLELQEKFAEIKQAERASKIKQERTEKLMQYTDNVAAYNLDTMVDETFDKLLSELKSVYEKRIADEKAESERLAKEQLAREAEQARIIEENNKLRKEAEAKEIEREIERKTEAEKQAKVEAEREAERKAAQAKLDEERAKIEKIEQEQREKLEAERQAQLAKEKAEKDAIKANEEKQMKELLAPDKDKLINFSKALEIIRTEKLPAVKTKQAQDVVNLIDEMLTKMQIIINDKAKEL